MRKIQDDEELSRQRLREIGKVRALIDSVKETKLEMEKKIREHRTFEKFLEDVVEQTEFLNTQDLINRYLALLEAKQLLGGRQEFNLKALETARSNMVRLNFTDQ